jgi:S-formylglutathione hydrolase
MTLTATASNRVANGTITKYTLPSASLGALTASVNVFVPDSAAQAPVPVLFYLAGLTCTEDTAAWKAGMFNTAGKEGIALVFPDTSPRGAGVEGEDDDWQLGTGE